MKLLKSKNVYLDYQLVPASVLINNEKIVDILPYDYQAEEIETFDLKDNYLTPGIIDLHNHGFAGWAFTSVLDQDDLILFSKRLASLGITSLLATTSFSGYQTIVDNYNHPDLKTTILGIHAEGPFLNDKQPGAANPHYGFPKPDLKHLEKMYQASHGLLKYLTMAVELEGTKSLLEFANAHNILVALGHSEASYQDVANNHQYLRAFTHVGNAMKGINHRAVGALGAALLMDDLYVEIIGDVLHLSKGMLEIIYRMKPLDKMVLVSDSTALSGLPAGKYNFPNNEVTITEEGLVVNQVGRLGGSSFPVLTHLKLLHEKLDWPLEELFAMISYNPARLINCFNEIGSIEKNKFANLIVLDQDLDLLKTFHRGELVYKQGQDLILTNPKLPKLINNPELLNYYK